MYPHQWRIVSRHPPPYLTRVVRRGRRRQQRRRWASATVVVLAVAIVVAVAYLALEGEQTTGSTTTTTTATAGRAPFVSTTTRPAPTGTGTTGAEPDGAPIYRAPLTGEAQVPPVSTPASGTLTLTVAADGSSVAYVLEVATITDLTVARLHEGRAGTNGPTIVTIYGGPGKSGTFSGVVTRDTFTAADFEGPLQGKKVADFAALIASGQVYLNVGTSAHITGELRGQVE